MRDRCLAAGVPVSLPVSRSTESGAGDVILTELLGSSRFFMRDDHFSD